MIDYSIVHHVPGRIRIGVPLIKGLSVAVLKQLSSVPIPAGIRDIHPNPVTGSLTIKYDPGNIDILEYLKKMASNMEIQNIIRKGGKNE